MRSAGYTQTTTRRSSHVPTPGVVMCDGRSRRRTERKEKAQWAFLARGRLAARATDIFRWKDSEGRSSRTSGQLDGETSDRFQNAMLCVTPVSRFVYFASLSTKNQERWDRSTRLDFLVLFHLRKKDEKPAVIKEERTRKKRIYP